MSEYWYYDRVNIDVLLGKVITEINELETSRGNECLEFVTDDLKRYHMTHDQDCCESVYLENTQGDLSCLLNTPILQAEESFNSDNHPEDFKSDDEYLDESFTWTFYKLATKNGYVTLRWLGSSNGYYSEDVNFYDVTNKNDD